MQFDISNDDIGLTHQNIRYVGTTHPGAKNHAYFAQHMYNALPIDIKK